MSPLLATILLFFFTVGSFLYFYTFIGGWESWEGLGQVHLHGVHFELEVSQEIVSIPKCSLVKQVCHFYVMEDREGQYD